MNFSDALKHMRKEARMTQGELAEALKLNIATVNRWENGRNLPAGSACMRIMRLAKERRVSKACITWLEDAMFLGATRSGINNMGQVPVAVVNQMVNESASGIYVCDCNTYDLLYVNQRAADMLELAIEDAAGKKCYEYFLHRDSPCPFCSMRYKSRKSFSEVEFVYPGTDRHFYLRGKLIDWNKRSAHIEYVTEDTVNYYKHTALSNMLNTLPCGVGVFHLYMDGRLELVQVNDRSYQILNASEQEQRRYAGFHVLDSLHPKDRNFAMSQLLSMVQTTKDAEFAVRILNHDKKYQWMRVLGTIAFEEGDRVVLYLAFSSIDRQKKMQHHWEEEKQRQELQLAISRAELASRVKSDFLENMSHDMRTPLHAIMGLTSLTIDEAENPDAVRENMTRIRSVSDYMLGLVMDVLDASRFQNASFRLHPEPYSVKEFTLNMKTMFAARCSQKNITLCISEFTVAPTILADKVHLNQIFFNLISNAIKYTQPGGHVDFRMENLTIRKNRLYVDNIVQDDGIGMSKEFQKRMFEPFAQEDTAVMSELQGAGLGLSIAKQLINLMGGTIEVESEPGKGTRVRVHLEFDLAKEEAAHLYRSEQEDSHRHRFGILKNRRVLLVEDHPINALVATKLLQKEGMLVVTAENGREALNKFMAARENTFDVILMDIRMPEMDGYTATGRIRSLERADAKTVPIIAMSANAFDEDREKSIQAGMNIHLAKPIDSGLLYKTIAEILEM